MTYVNDDKNNSEAYISAEIRSTKAEVFYNTETLMACFEEELIERLPKSSLTVQTLNEIDRLQIISDNAYKYSIHTLRKKYTITKEMVIYYKIAVFGLIDEECKEYFATHARKSEAETPKNKYIMNFYRGLTSFDISQRDRFWKLYETENFFNNGIENYMHILEVLEPAKEPPKRKGRPKEKSNMEESYSEKIRKIDAPLLIEMKRLHALGKTINAASLEVVKQPDGSIDKNHAKRLDRKFRDKMKLREL